jgi:sortase B
MDFRNDRGMSDRNTILYGHHMNNGTMFAKLVGYKRQAFYDEHKIFQFMTPDQNFQLDVVAAYVANTKMDAWKLGFPEDADAESWIGNALKRSVIQTGYTYTPGDRFITLSTCTYEFDNARFVVIGVIRNQ